jgi:hypothetical protein
VSPTLLPGLAALIGTLAGVAVTYLVATRRSSGRIRTSEAEILWEASESIRHDLTAEVAVLRGEVAALKAELAQLRARVGGGA